MPAYPCNIFNESKENDLLLLFDMFRRKPQVFF